MKSNNIELRLMDFKVDDANVDDDSLIVRGYVNKTEHLSQVMGYSIDFQEKIQKGAFTRALEKEGDVHFLAEHDGHKLLSSTRNGSLKLKEDEIGLYMEAEITPTSFGKDYYQLIKSGILRNMSFGFWVEEDEWTTASDDMRIRTITDLTLLEVSVVTNPAYLDSTIEARGIEIVKKVKCGIDEQKQEPVQIRYESKEEMAKKLKKLKEINEVKYEY